MDHWKEKGTKFVERLEKKTKKKKNKQTVDITKKFVGGLLSATVNSDIFKSWASIPN